MACISQNIILSKVSSKRSVSVASCGSLSAPKALVKNASTKTMGMHAPLMHKVGRVGPHSNTVVKASYSGNITSAPGVKYAIIVAQFNSLITKSLLEGCKESFVFRGVAENDIDVFSVPGSFELPVIAKSLAASGKYGAVVCLGAVIKGATSHYDTVVGAATNGILNAGVNTGVPVVFGVLTCENLEQALDRAGGKLGNKGAEFAAVAVEMASLVDKIKKF